MADDPKTPETPTPPQAAADKPASSTPAEPLKGEVSRTDAPGAGASAAPVGPPRQEPPAPKPAIPGAVDGVSLYLGDWTILASLAKIDATLRHLRDAPDARFDYLSDLTATDWPPRKDARFDVIYCLYSTRLRHRVRVKVKVGEQQ